MTAWSVRTLGELCTLRAGIVFKPADQGLEFGDFPFIKVSDMNLVPNAIAIREANNWVHRDYVARVRARLFPAGTTVFAKIGEALRQNRVRKIVRPTLIDNNMMGAIPNLTLVTPEFLYYRLASFDIAATATGTALPYLTVSTLEQQRFRIPPHALQRRIASVLSAYDDLIENNTRRIAILEEMARRIYEEWFVRFRFPGHEGVRMVETETGLVPDGWAIETLDDCALVTMGQSPSSEFYNDAGHGLPFHQGVTNFGRHFPTHRTYCTSEGRTADEGDILVSVRAPVGRINLSPTRLIIGRGLCAVRSKAGQQTYLLHRLLETFREEDSMGNGAIFKAVSKQEVLGLEFFAPPRVLVDKFESVARPIWLLIRNLSAKNTNLRTTRDLLLPKLISGELDVSTLPDPEAVAA